MAFTVAIDGPAAAGKGTIARAVAKRFGFSHLDTGLLYRATGKRMLDGAEPVDAARSLQPEDLNADDLRTPEVAQAASRVAAISEVRTALVDFQRKFASQPGGAILDGRDIGTVICPNADVKLYVTANDEIRAQRRLEELLAKDHDTDFDSVLSDLMARDARDRARDSAPLRPADDAKMLDTSTMSIDEAILAAEKIIEATLTSAD